MALTLRPASETGIWNVLWFIDAANGAIHRVGVRTGEVLGEQWPNFDEVRTRGSYKLTPQGVDLMPTPTSYIRSAVGGTPRYDTTSGFLDPGDYVVRGRDLIIQRRVPLNQRSIPMYVIPGSEWTGNPARPNTLNGAGVSQLGPWTITAGILTSAVD